MIDSFDPLDVWQSFGAFSMGVLQGSGQIVHLKGPVALDRAGQVIGGGDMRAQVRQVLENIRAVLASIGGEMTDILSLTQYVTSIADFMQAGDIRREFFSAPYPVTTTVQVGALFRPELVVEITAIAEVPRERFKRAAAWVPGSIRKRGVLATSQGECGDPDSDLAPLLPSLMAGVGCGCGPWWTGWQRRKA